MIVDANVVVFWSVDTPFSASARSHMQRGDLAAPAFLLIETAQALLKYRRIGAIGLPEIEHAMRLAETAVDLADDRPLIGRALSLAVEHSHSLYDCVYLALALQRGEPLATADRKLAEVARHAGVEVVLIEAG